MSEGCVDRCAPKRDMSFFDEKSGLILEDLPRFPIREQENMTKQEKYMSVVVYLSKVVDHLQGVDNGKDIHNSRGCKILANLKKQNVLSGPKESDTSSQDR